jgi:hypothetical protein
MWKAEAIRNTRTVFDQEKEVAKKEEISTEKLFESIGQLTLKMLCSKIQSITH